MKKFTSFILCVILLSFPVCAGGLIQPTDISVELYGKKIPSVCVNNQMYIPADDLCHFGYTVTYIDEIRTLFVNKTGEPDGVVPAENKISKTLGTDIKVFINGKQVEKSATFAANGKMYVSANVIARYSDGNNLSDSAVKGYPHALTKEWSEENRTLSLCDAVMPTKEEQKALWLSYGGNREEYSFLSFTETEYKGEGFDVVCLRVGGLPRGSEESFYYFGDDGKTFSINAICNVYSLHKYGGGSTITNVRVEGRKMYFDASRLIMAEPQIKSEWGSYCLDFDTTAISVINGQE